MRRKLIKQGLASYTISLPAKWVKERDLQAGDEIEICRENQHLIVKSFSEQNSKAITIRINEEKETLIRIKLNNAYRSGYKKIHVTFTSDAQREMIERTVKDLLPGFEFLSRKDKKITIQSIAEPNTEKIEFILRKMFFLVQDTCKLVTSLLESPHDEIREKIKNNTNDVDKYNNFFRRNIHKTKSSHNYNFFMWSLITYLSQLQHVMNYLGDRLSDTSIESNDKKLWDVLSTSFQDIHKALYKRDKKTITQTGKKINTFLRETLLVRIQQTQGDASLLLHYYSTTARVMFMMTSPLLGALFSDQKTSF